MWLFDYNYHYSSTTSAQMIEAKKRTNQDWIAITFTYYFFDIFLFHLKKCHHLKCPVHIFTSYFLWLAGSLLKLSISRASHCANQLSHAQHRRFYIAWVWWIGCVLYKSLTCFFFVFFNLQQTTVFLKWQHH